MSVPEALVTAAVEALREYETQPYGDLRLNAERAAAKALAAAFAALPECEEVNEVVRSSGLSHATSDWIVAALAKMGEP